MNKPYRSCSCRAPATTGPDGKRLHTVAEIAQTAGVHRTTVYDYLNKEG